MKLIKLGKLSLLIVIVSSFFAIISGPLYQLGLISLGTALLKFLKIPITYGVGIAGILAIIAIVSSIRTYQAQFYKHSHAAIVSLFLSFFIISIPYSLLDLKAPMIHEVSTDLESPPKFIKILNLRKNSPNASDYTPVVSRYGKTVNVRDEQERYYPNIKSLRVKSIKDLFSIAEASVKKMEWTLISSNKEKGIIEAYDKSFWYGFIDDIVIRITKKEEETIVDIRSKSRVGFGDFGANAKRIRKFLTLFKENI